MGRQPGFRGSIRDRILVPYLVLIVALVGITGLACGGWASLRAREEYLDRGRGIAETLRRSHFPLTGPVLDQLKGLGGAEFALLDREGSVVSTTLPGLAGPIHPSADAGLSFGPALDHGGTSYRFAAIERPVGSGAGPGSGRADRLVILLPEPALELAGRRASRAVLALSLLGAGLAGGLATWLGRSLSGPLTEILRATRQIGRGDLAIPPLPVRDDEIGELAEGVRQMADRLRSLEAERSQTERLQLVRQVSAGLAHELRNPLMAARMTLQIFIERNRDRDAEPLEIALAELGRMERQLRRFLQLARPDPPRLERVEPGTIVDRAVSGLAATAEHLGVELVSRVDAELPKVRVDTEQVGQAVANLCLNAIDAAGPGGQVRVAAEVRGASWVAIVVEDDGAGLADEVASRLFDPFVTTKPEGVGLGLPLALALIREHGGSIRHERVDSRTRFEVTLPVAPTDRSDETTREPVALASGGRVGWPT